MPYLLKVVNTTLDISSCQIKDILQALISADTQKDENENNKYRTPILIDYFYVEYFIT